MANATPPNISARIFYGLRTDIQYNAHFLTESEIIYPAGGVIVIHNHLQKKQKFIRLQDKHKPIKSLVLSPNRRWLALNEIAEEGQKPIITIYDLTTYKRRKILTVPFENSTAKEFACVQFTFDSKYLVAITGEPDWYLYYYNWDKGKVESHAKAQNPSGQGIVESVQCNPSDATLVVITGPYTFRIMNVSETVWRQWGWCKSENINITSCMWLTPDRILFGTDNGLIMMVENGELRQNCVFKAAEVLEMSLKKVEAEAEETVESSSSKQDTSSDKETSLFEEVYPVTNFVNFPKGFVFACGPGYVHMFEKETPHHWRKRNLYRISKRSYKHTREHPVWSELDAIQHITVDPNQETLLITTLRKQLYHVKLFGQHMLQNPEIPFVELGPAMHYGRINSLSMCAWKPIFMTSGEEDKSIRIWNYMTDDVELIRLYQEEIHCVSLHPTGLFAIVGFSDKLRFMVVLIDDFEVMREFPIRNCKRAKFSINGHLFAAVNGQVIQVFSSTSFQNVYNLKGHNGKVTSLAWSANDLSLVSCGSEGAVYEWSMSTGQRVGEVILKTNQFNACSVNSVGKTTYGVGSDGEIKEIGSNTIRRNLPLIGCALDTIVLSRSDMMLFITGGEGGVLEEKHEVTQNCNNLEKGNNAIPKSIARGTYFVSDININSAPESLEADLYQKSPTKLEKYNVDMITNISEKLVNKIMTSAKSTHARETSLAQFEQLEKAANYCNDTNVACNDFGNVKILKEKRTYFDDKSTNVVKDEILISPKSNKEKKVYFDNIDVNIETTANKKEKDIAGDVNKQLDDTRSPSIVKDEILIDYKPSTLKILLGDNLTRQKPDSIDIFEELDSPHCNVKTNESHNIVENTRQLINQLVLEQKSASKVNTKNYIKSEQPIIHEDPLQKSNSISLPTDRIVSQQQTKETVHLEKANAKVASQDERKTETNQDNTIEEFENIYKDITAPRATEFDLLVSQETSNITIDEKGFKSAVEATKYNLRHKSHTKELRVTDKVETGEVEEVLLESSAKCENKTKLTKRSLRLRKRRNQTESEDKSDLENDNKLKDIVNLQKEFSDVCLDVPAPVKEIKDIESPKKPDGEQENVPPLMGIQSCPSKSVTRSRRKLFTPRTEPLEEGEAPGDSNERLYVPRPSYHRARARRKL